MGVCRDTFYRYRQAVEDGGVEAPIEDTRRKPNPKNRVDQAIEQAVIEYALEQPAHGQVRASNELRKRGTFVSPTGVRGCGPQKSRNALRIRGLPWYRKSATARP
jgi:hypothetical protein